MTFPSKPRPASGLDCFTYAIFARQQYAGDRRDLVFGEELGELDARHLEERPCYSQDEVPGQGISGCELRIKSFGVEGRESGVPGFEFLGFEVCSLWYGG